MPQKAKGKPSRPSPLLTGGLHCTEKEVDGLPAGVWGPNQVPGSKGLSLEKYILFNQRAKEESRAGKPRNTELCLCAPDAKVVQQCISLAFLIP